MTGTTLTALFQQDVKLDSLMQSLREAGIADEQVSIMTPLPLSEQASARVGAMPLYLVTMIAGLVGISCGYLLRGWNRRHVSLDDGRQADRCGADRRHHFL